MVILWNEGILVTPLATISVGLARGVRESAGKGKGGELK